MIPIVFPTVGDPVAQGLVASLASPGGNITGLSIVSPEISAKQLELLKEVVPGVTRIARLMNPANPAYAPIVREVEVAARLLGVQLRAFWVSDPNEFDKVFSDMIRERTEGLIVSGDVMLHSQRARLTDLAAKNRLPTIFPYSDYVEAGGLISYATSITDNYRRATTYVDKILKGTKPGDLPVEQPTKFELVINLKTAKALGLTIPQTLLLRANQVIE
jgi:ABC-type uncharacterized transport system substrate-binding protein